MIQPPPPPHHHHHHHRLLCTYICHWLIVACHFFSSIIGDSHSLIAWNLFLLEAGFHKAAEVALHRLGQHRVLYLHSAEAGNFCLESQRIFEASKISVTCSDDRCRVALQVLTRTFWMPWKRSFSCWWGAGPQKPNQQEQHLQNWTFAFCFLSPCVFFPVPIRKGCHGKLSCHAMLPGPRMPLVPWLSAKMPTWAPSTSWNGGYN